MSRLPLLSWRDVAEALAKAGFRVARQKGSHIILVKGEHVVPIHKHGEIKRGLLQAIIAETGLTGENLKLVDKVMGRRLRNSIQWPNLPKQALKEFAPSGV